MERAMDNMIASTMSVTGEIVGFGNKLASLKIKTELGFAYVWVWEEIQVKFQIGDEFEACEAPLTFYNGYPIAIIKPGVGFFLNHIRYETKEAVTLQT